MRDKVKAAAQSKHRSRLPAQEPVAIRPAASPPQEKRDGAENLILNLVPVSAPVRSGSFCLGFAHQIVRNRLSRVGFRHLT
jgi:hypothetical protein